MTEVGGKLVIYTGIRIAGHVDRKKLKRRRDGFCSPKISFAALEKSLRTLEDGRRALATGAVGWKNQPHRTRGQSILRFMRYKTER